MFYFKIINAVLKNDMSILKQIVWESQNWQYILPGQAIQNFAPFGQ